MNLALASAISLPDPIAMPTSAAVNACSIVMSTDIIDTSEGTNRRIVDTVSYHGNDLSSLTCIIILWIFTSTCPTLI